MAHSNTKKSAISGKKVARSAKTGRFTQSSPPRRSPSKTDPSKNVGKILRESAKRDSAALIRLANR